MKPGKSRSAATSNLVLEIAVQFGRFLDRCKLAYCLIGGIALQRWGEPRIMSDVDLTVFTGFGQERPLIEKLLVRFQSRVPDPMAFTLQTRSMPLQDVHGSKIDLSFGGI